MEVVEVSDKPKICGNDDENFNKLPVACEDFDFEDDDDDVPLLLRFSQISNLGTCSNKQDASVEKKTITTVPVKRVLDNTKSLHIVVKDSKVSPYDYQEKNEDDIRLSDIKMPDKSSDKCFSSMKINLGLLEKSFEACKRKRLVEKKRLRSVKRDIEECCKELESKKKKVCSVRRINEAHDEIQGKIDECMKDFVVKEKQLYLMEDLIRERKQELETKEIELRQVIDNIEKDRERKEEELKALSRKNTEFTLVLKAKEKDLDTMNKLIGKQVEKLMSERTKILQEISIMKNECTQMKEFESMKKQFEDQVKELESKQKQCEGLMVELESKKKNFEGELKELESRKKELEGNMKEFESKEETLEGRMKELESKEKQVEGRAMELESREMQHEGREKEFKSKVERYEDQVKELEFKNERFESQLKVLESVDNQLVSQVKDFETKKQEFECQMKESASKQKHFESRMEELESKEKLFEGRVQELESREKQLESKDEEFKGRVKELESKTKQLEGRWKALELKENMFKVKVKELDLQEKQFEGKVKDPESMRSKFDGQLKEPKSRKRYIDEEKESVTSYMNDGLSCTIGGTSLQLDASEKTDGVESLYNGILVNMVESSDPSRLVLDMIQNPIIPLCKKGDNAEIIADYHIYLLEQLMRITPNIKPCVREEALMLALDLKANMKENSLTVLAFLLLLSIFGLLTSFNEDEVMELFAFVSQHNLAIELFGTLGFANKVSDFVKNLTTRKQFVAAVRFSCAYCLADKNQLVVMLREHVQNAKLICDSSCEKTNSIEIKDKARDQEIASLRTVLQCISDCNLQSEDMLLDKDIKYRILELKANKGI